MTPAARLPRTERHLMDNTSPNPNPPGQFVVVDVETSRLAGRNRVMVEAALLFLDETLAVTERLEFVPFHDRGEMLRHAEPEALAVNRYFERRLFSEMLSRDETAAIADRLLTRLVDATLVGANPAFDQVVLWDWLRDYTTFTSETLPPWNYRLWDVQAATAAIHGLPALPSLSECCEVWGFDRNPELAHTAYGDAEITAAVFRKIRAAALKVQKINTATAAEAAARKPAGYIFGSTRR